LSRVEEVLGVITPLGELVVDLSCLRPFGLEAASLDIVVDSVEPMHEGVKLLLLLLEAFLTSEDSRLALALFIPPLGWGILRPPLFLFYGSVTTKKVLLTTSTMSVSGSFVESWLGSSSKRLRMEVGWCPMTTTNIEGEAPSAFCLMAMASWLRHRLSVAARILRHRFSVLLLAVAECTGPPALIIAELTGGGGEKVNGTKADAAPGSEGLSNDECG
jgi:hypothetical protein